jgi:orotidine-5'-phosphate decarboxylase
VKAGLKVDASGQVTGTIIVNSSRAVLYASSGDDFASAGRQVAQATRLALQAAR